MLRKVLTVKENFEVTKFIESKESSVKDIQKECIAGKTQMYKVLKFKEELDYWANGLMVV